MCGHETTRAMNKSTLLIIRKGIRNPVRIVLNHLNIAAVVRIRFARARIFPTNWLAGSHSILHMTMRSQPFAFHARARATATRTQLPANQLLICQSDCQFPQFNWCCECRSRGCRCAAVHGRTLSASPPPFRPSIHRASASA